MFSETQLHTLEARKWEDDPPVIPNQIKKEHHQPESPKARIPTYVWTPWKALDMDFGHSTLLLMAP